MKTQTTTSEKMQAKKSYLAKVMKAAWTTFRRGGKTFSQAMKSAWAWAKKTISQEKPQNDNTRIAFGCGLNFGVIAKETEKAVFVDHVQYYTNSAYNGLPRKKGMWIPKSQLVVVDEELGVTKWFAGQLNSQSIFLS